jgi:hypothetical protein
VPADRDADANRVNPNPDRGTTWTHSDTNQDADPDTNQCAHTWPNPDADQNVHAWPNPDTNWDICPTRVAWREMWCMVYSLPRSQNSIGDLEVTR